MHGQLQADSASTVSYSVREAALWVFAALATIMLVALLTYDARDPGFSHTGDGTAVRNQIGAAGAWFADVTYSLFGIPAYLFPIMVMAAGWFIFSARNDAKPLDRKVIAYCFPCGWPPPRCLPAFHGWPSWTGLAIRY